MSDFRREGGKHTKLKTSKKINKKTIWHLLIVLLLIVISITTAYLLTKSSLENAFVVGKVAPEIIEKEDVKIKNSGNVPIYVKVAIIVSWKDANGTIVETEPVENTDYSIDFSTSENWLYSNGYYYYKKPLAVNEVTDVLVNEYVQLKEYDDKTLYVDIAVQAIQAEPEKAVEEAWGIQTADNTLVIEE